MCVLCPPDVTRRSAIEVPDWLARLGRFCLAAAGAFCFWLLLESPAHAADGAPDPSSTVDTVAEESVEVLRDAVGARPSLVDAPLPAAPVTPTPELPSEHPDEVVEALDDRVRHDTSGPASRVVEGGHVPAAQHVSVVAVPSHEASEGRAGEHACEPVPAQGSLPAETALVLLATTDSYPPAPRPGPCTPQAVLAPASGGSTHHDTKAVVSGAPVGTTVAASGQAATFVDRLRHESAEPPVSPD